MSTAAQDQADAAPMRREMVRRLIEVHGGTARAFSEGEGKGAMFELELPLAVSLAPRVEEDLRPTRSLRVVVCDDESDICDLAANLLLRQRPRDVDRRR